MAIFILLIGPVGTMGSSIARDLSNWAPARKGGAQTRPGLPADAARRPV